MSFSLFLSISSGLVVFLDAVLALAMEDQQQKEDDQHFSSARSFVEDPTSPTKTTKFSPSPFIRTSPLFEEHNQDEKDLVQKLSTYLHERLKDRLLSCYVIGSLVHGGYVRDFSDIDFAIVLDNLHMEDEDFMQILGNDIRKLDWKLANRVSLFWGSVDSINKGTGGKFYIPDIIDLIENGILVHGQDIRHQLMSYSNDQLINSVITYFFHRFPFQIILEDLQCADFTFRKHAHIQYIRRICHQVLLPLRFMYTLETASLGFNHVVVDYYLDRFDSNSASFWLVKEICLCRRNKCITENLESHVLKYKIGLAHIYVGLMDLCLKFLTKINNLEKITQIQSWKSTLEKILTTPAT